MIISEMYINPAIIMVLIAVLMALLAVGGVLWKLAGVINDVKIEIGGVKKDVAVMTERLDGHIKVCELAAKKT